MSSTTPSATRKSASLLRLQVENGRSWSCGRVSANLLISRRWARVKGGGPPPAYCGYSASNPSRLKLCSTSRTRSGLVKVTLAMAGTSMPCADSSTICARRQVTTDPELRRTIRSSRLPSSLVMSRTRTRSATCSLPRPDVVGSLHQDAAKRATSYFSPIGRTLPDAALASPGSYQAGLISDGHQLGPVAGLQLGQQPAHIGLGRGRADHQ